MVFYRTRRRLSPEEKAANLAAERERSAKAMSCQICGRLILANTGMIAHHGYERPYEGLQTASCSGARFLPYESSREQLGQYIVALKSSLASTRERLANIIAEKGELSLEYQERDPNNWRRRFRKVLWVCRGNFDVTKEANADIFHMNGWDNFNNVKTMHIRRIEGQIRHLELDIVHQEKRFAEWKHTHDFRNGVWAVWEGQ